MNDRVRAVMAKEFAEYRRNKLIILTMGLLPVIFLVLPIITVITLPDDVPAAAVTAVAGQALLLFLLIPVILPTTVAAYTVIGEREQLTLEPVLATPATDGELLAGKALAATIPAVILAWSLFGVFLAVVGAVGSQPVQDEIFRFDRIFAQVVLAPPLATFAIELSMMISMRSTDIRVAQQLSGLSILPAVGALALFSFDVVEPSVGRYLAAAAVLAAVDLAVVRTLIRMFDRERILTRFGA